jgi:fatty acid desaturase
MDESFERRPLLDRGRLRSLQTRSDLQSTLHLALQVLAFALCAAGIVGFSDRPVVALPLAIALGGITASFFAPFHECIHQTAFRTRRANRVAAWIAAIPFCMAPSVYRVFHWEHHRHTQDRECDPEILSDPNSLSPWPKGTGQWFRLWSGSIMFAIKTVPSVLLAVIPVSRWDSFSPQSTGAFPTTARSSPAPARCSPRALCGGGSGT